MRKGKRQKVKKRAKDDAKSKKEQKMTK